MIEVGGAVRKLNDKKNRIMLVQIILFDEDDTEDDKIICLWVNKRGDAKQGEFKRKDLLVVV
jgi:hypothetical protein